MQEYRVMYPISDVTATSQPAQLDHPRAFATLGAKYGLADMSIGSNDQVTLTIEQEYNKYVTSGLSYSRTDPLAFWEMERNHYPTIFRMAMDYLPVQPSAVPCKRAFSSSSLTDTKQRNRLSPTLMEALQILKFSLKKEKPTLKWRLVTEREMLQHNGESDVLAEAIQGQNTGSGELDRVIQEIAIEEGDKLQDGIAIY